MRDAGTDGLAVIPTEHATSLLDRAVIGSDGAQLGAVAQVFLEHQTGRPNWMAVAGSPLSKRRRILPLVGAVLSVEGLLVPFDRRTIVNAPQLEGFTQRLPDQYEALLHRYYHSSRVDFSQGLAVVNVTPRHGDDRDDRTDDERYERLITPLDLREFESLQPFAAPRAALGNRGGAPFHARLDNSGRGL